jgi:hypothetical protein
MGPLTHLQATAIVQQLLERINEELPCLSWRAVILLSASSDATGRGAVIAVAISEETFHMGSRPAAIRLCPRAFLLQGLLKWPDFSAIRRGYGRHFKDKEGCPVIGHRALFSVHYW